MYLNKSAISVQDIKTASFHSTSETIIQSNVLRKRAHSNSHLLRSYCEKQNLHTGGILQYHSSGSVTI